MKVNSILMAVIIGISQGTQPIVGFNYGAKSYERVRQTLRLSLSYGLAVSIIGWACFQLFTAPILSVFGTGDPLYFEFATHFMKIFLSLSCVISIQIISSGYFSAVGKPLKGMVLSLTRQVLFFIPLVLILPHFFRLRWNYVQCAGCGWRSLCRFPDFCLLGMEAFKTSGNRKDKDSETQNGLHIVLIGL